MNIIATVVIAGGGLMTSLLFLLVCGIIIGIILWLISIAPFIPALFKQVLSFVVYFVAALILINFLLSLTGHPIYAIG